MDFSIVSKSTFLFFFFFNVEMNALTSYSLGVGGRICMKSSFRIINEIVLQ